MRVCFRSTKGSLDLVVEDEDESATSSSDDVGEASLEEGLATLVLVDLLEAVHGASVEEISSAGLHHQSTSDGVEGVRSDTGGDSDALSEAPHGEEVSLLGIGEENGLTGIEGTEVRGSVNDDTNDGDSETSVETNETIRLVDLI